jgi:hypothetical protein
VGDGRVRPATGMVVAAAADPGMYLAVRYVLAVKLVGKVCFKRAQLVHLLPYTTLYVVLAPLHPVSLFVRCPLPPNPSTHSHAAAGLAA